ncbi:MAG: fibronectin type III domain-containing protein [Clostridiales Family XIII bacterium]|jgi:hypothetical protein|nr:fibronectin type III domain-containing protein [Clostridiales Family XIII bacterium]
MGGQSSVSAAVSAPTFPHVKRVSSTSLNLNWKKAAGASGYEVYRYDGKKHKYAKVKTIKKAAAVRWTDRKLKTGKKYTYKVRAFIKKGKKKKYSAFTYAVSAVPYRKNAKVVNAGEVRGYDGVQVYMGESKKYWLDSYWAEPSYYGTAKKKRVVDEKLRILMDANAYVGLKRNVITGKKEGGCNAYVVAHNGNVKKVRIDVLNYANPPEWSNLDKVDSTALYMLTTQKTDLAAVVSYLAEHNTTPGAIYYYGIDEKIFSNDSNIYIAPIREQLDRLLLDCPKSLDIYVDYSTIKLVAYFDTVQTTLTYYIDQDHDAEKMSPSIKIAPHWFYDKFIGK